MQLQILTSISNMQPISDLPYLFDLAKCAKCQKAVALKSTNKLYCTSEDSSAIHEIDIPFLLNTDILFRLDQETKAVMEKYTEFFIPDMYKHVILPSCYWEMYIGGDILADFDYGRDQFILYDKTTNQKIDQIQMFSCRETSDYDIIEFFGQLEGYFNRCRTLGEPHEFHDMQNNEAVRYVYDNKVSAGRVLCKLQNDKVNTAFYFYKGMFSLAKSDTLDIDLRFDKFQTSTFMLTFKPKRKKNPLKFNTYGVPFSERIHCMFISIV